ncbi:unnamed protein product [Owenia fusiformis]|uniref:Uncharacterized protein n=1 Tax=Owenia fusiformis TaxID=6347 RepID=A0A8J1TUJ5_OWEFU|nr:unnamed protein product [Owenia fusiformis]
MPSKFKNTLKHTGHNFQHSYSNNICTPTSLHRHDFRAPGTRDLQHKILDKRSPKVEKPNIIWGDDIPERRTSYNIHHCDPAIQSGIRSSRAPPPLGAEILPPQNSHPTGHVAHCTMRAEYPYLGHEVSQQIFTDRRKDLQLIKKVQTTDSVHASQQGAKRKMMSRVMIDYTVPADRVKGDNIKAKMVQTISPYVREDSIWNSIGGRLGEGKRLNYKTIQTLNYIWPPQRGTKANRYEMVKVR